MVEHVIGNDGVVSPILTSGTIFDNAPKTVPFFVCIPNLLISPIFEVEKRAFFDRLSDFLFLTISNCMVHLIYFGLLFLSQSFQ